MSIEDLKNRFKKFAIEVALLIQTLPKNTINYAYCNPLVRCSSSPGTNYRAASRARSTRDFINKLKIVEKELDESIFFLELLQTFNPHFDEIFNKNIKEANELLAITVASIKTPEGKNNLAMQQHLSFIICNS
jgi:four helix bundle protein